jgi:phytoene synthase
MDNYNSAAAASSRAVITNFSTSFGLASKLFTQDIRQDIYNIYGLVRLADEVVDSYRGPDAAACLSDLEHETYHSLSRNFSSNLVVHAFSQTASRFNITEELIRPFFKSMKIDLDPNSYSPKLYEDYIYGSAEVVGLMCLKVFTQGDDGAYERLVPGARALGVAFQKVNFLRDLAADYRELGRYYFPLGSFDGFDEKTKAAIISDIKKDFSTAKPAIEQLPQSVLHTATMSSCYANLMLRQQQ